MPLFKADKPWTPGFGYIMIEADGKYMWPFFKTMLEKVEALVPNLDPAHRVLGGFSNGAHATAALIDGSDGEVSRRFSAFLFVEGAGKLKHYDWLKGKKVMMVSSNLKSKPRAQQILVQCPLSPFNYSHEALAGLFYLCQYFLPLGFPDVALGGQVSLAQIPENGVLEFLHTLETAG
jgi:hypothetical protein